MITTVIVGVWFRDNGHAFHADHGNHRKRIPLQDARAWSPAESEHRC
jgi:hypothetical protein